MCSRFATATRKLQPTHCLTDSRILKHHQPFRVKWRPDTLSGQIRAELYVWAQKRKKVLARETEN